MPPSALPASSAVPSALSLLPAPYPAACAQVAPPPSQQDHLHCIVPYASLAEGRSRSALAGVALPHLNQLLQCLQPAAVDTGDEDTPIPPHERALAQALGLNPLAPAWAACPPDPAAPTAATAATAAADGASAWLTPCHWTAGADQVRMDHPGDLALDMHEAQALHAILAPWFAEDGLTLTVVSPLLWRVQGTPLQGLPTASLDRVVLRDVRHWLPPAASARQLHRLHSEVQMLLYTHPLNDARSDRGLLPVNAFWLHGAGAGTASVPATSCVHVLDDLRQAALRQDGAAWVAAWQAADAGPLAAMVQHVAAGGSATLTLCGELHARSYTTAPRSWRQKIQSFFGPKSFQELDLAL